jgi:Sporulation and spore germination
VKRRTGPAVLMAVLCCALAGCAVPTQGAPQSIPPSKVPFSLLNPHLPTTTTTLPNLSSLVPVKVYFLNAGSQLQAEGRVVHSPAPLQAILNSLMAGPSQGEAANGVTTALPDNVAVLSTTTQGNVVTVNMNSAFGQITGNNTELAVGQIVATVANENGWGTGVVFEIEGQHTNVPIANGSLVSGPVYLLQVLRPGT